ncbi:MAG: hypothetical protein E7201_00390 [Selenomonas ruminantium]|uniref:Alpha-1,2-fucosyltransferase n=1 Tax=Selenomonas ruminantium TaxID=971 RepID=A0A927ZRQ5_SELRU|nr:hypothetical protein [Selenomonas ruminantium]
MLILHLSTGLANMVYEYCAAYALAQELGVELCIDITNFMLRGEQFTLDLLNIPAVKKVYNLNLDPEHLAQGDPLCVAPELRRNAITLVQPGVYIGSETDSIMYYHSLADARKVKEKAAGRNIILNGYFFDKKYYLPYWERIRKFLCLRNETAETLAFQKIAKGRPSVGIHIRRGDFQVADFAATIEKEYWQAAVVFMREYLNDPIFFVFSDDIDYAVSVLGTDSRIFYIKCLGAQRADLQEFICLSRCDHRILNVCSTFSGLADELHGGTRITVWKGINLADKSMAMEKNNREKNLQADGLRRVLLYPEEIMKRASTYSADGKTHIMAHAIDELEEIADNSVRGKAIDNNARESMLLRKMALDLKCQNYEEAYEISQVIYVKCASDTHYQEMLREILQKLNYEEEVAIEKARDFGEHYHFIIAPYLDCPWSIYRIGLAELGNILYHMGHEVTYLFDTKDKGEMWYIRNNPIYMNRYSEKRGGEQFLLSDLLQKYGSWTNVIKRFANNKVRNIVISRNLDCLIAAKGINDVMTIFPDFSDNRCIESVYGDKCVNTSELARMYNEADIIFSHKYRAENTYDWQDRGHLDYRDEIGNGEQVVNLGYHFKPLYVGLAFKIKDILQEIYKERRSLDDLFGRTYSEDQRL